MSYVHSQLTNCQTGKQKSLADSDQPQLKARLCVEQSSGCCRCFASFHSLYGHLV